MIKIINPYYSFGQNYESKIGGKSVGLANITANTRSIYSSFGNPAELIHTSYPIITASYENRFSLLELSTMSVGIILPLKNSSCLGMNILRFGSELYNEHTIGVSYAHRLDKTSLGARIDYFQIQIANQPLHYSFRIHLGGSAEITPHLLFSAYVTNLSRAIFDNYDINKSRISLLTGIAYQPSSFISLFTEIEKNNYLPPTLRVGIEYIPIPNLFFRIGVAHQPIIFSGGIGIHAKRLVIDYGTAYHFHSYLGFVHQLSLGYLLRK